MHRDDFPTIFAIALDHLAIQASSVPCERAFSSAAETNTVRRNKLGPVMMEALQMLKFGFRNEPFNFTQGILTDEEDLAIPTAGTSINNLNFLEELSHSMHTDTQREDAIDRFILAEG
jgi:hypothetical protein